jgi:hypothetical protein
MATEVASRLVLGTAQLGMRYGIGNRTGVPASEEIDRMLLGAHALGIRTLDTAQCYGNSEVAIGGFLAGHPGLEFDLISKIDPAVDPSEGGAVRAAAEESVAVLGRPLDGLLIHNPVWLDDWDQGIGEALVACRNAGLARALGISIYTPGQFRRALEIDDLEIVQAPFNVLDRRLSDSDLLACASDLGRRVYLRGVFLQGVLLMRGAELPAAMGHATGPVDAWHALCARWAADPLETALGFALRTVPDSMVVVGCETLAQIEQNVAAARGAAIDDALTAAIHALPQGEERLVNPALWDGAIA